MFYSDITVTSNYIDSLVLELNRLDGNDAKNVKIVKDIFLTNEAGDDLFNRINVSCENAENISLRQATKSSLIKSGNNLLFDRDRQKFKSFYFGLNSPLGVMMTLYAFESELLKIGEQCLQDYTHTAVDM